MPQPPRGNPLSSPTSSLPTYLLNITLLGGLLGACAPKMALVAEDLRVPMADGVDLATLALRPEGPGPFPTILLQSRYWRAYALRVPEAPGMAPVTDDAAVVNALLQAGYAVVLVDVRGTGASTGTWTHPWSAAERADAARILDWIVAQPWSDGRLGATGLSYGGTAALLTAGLGRNDLKVVLARQVEWELVEELLAPGGIRNTSFVTQWSTAVADLDHGRVPDFFPANARMMVRTVRPAGESAEDLAKRLQARPTVDVAAAVSRVRAADHTFGADGPPAGSLGPSELDSLRSPARQTRVGIWSSWWDGATARGALQAATDLDLTEVRIGPWNHEGTRSLSPWANRGDGLSEPAAVVAFFDLHLKGESSPPPIRAYWEGQAERWQESDDWPITTMYPLYLGPDGQLSGGPAAAPTTPSSWSVAPDPGASSGEESRWTTGMLQDIAHEDRSRAPGLVSFASAPFDHPVRLFGSPELVCSLRVAAPADLHLYLELIDPSGRVRLLTEAHHRLMGPLDRLPLLPQGVQIKAGQAIRLSFAGEDRPVFEEPPGPLRAQLHTSPEAPCRLDLPLRTDPGGP